MTDRYALLGHPVSHSRSPAVHAAFAKQSGQDISYELIDVPPGTLKEFLPIFLEQGGKGGNITLPLKLEAASLVDKLSERASLAGAVNTFWLDENNKLHGDNTDGFGLVQDITVNLGVNLKDKRVLVLGAGGAARGVIHPLLSRSPASLIVANRTLNRATDMLEALALTGDIKAVTYDKLGKEPYDVVINATSASLDNTLLPLPLGLFNTGALAYDLVNLEQPTVFMDWALKHGASKAQDGWGMLVEQAAESFWDWRGVRIHQRLIGVRPE